MEKNDFFNRSKINLNLEKIETINNAIGLSSIWYTTATSNKMYVIMCSMQMHMVNNADQQLSYNLFPCDFMNILIFFYCNIINRFEKEICNNENEMTFSNFPAFVSFVVYIALIHF